MNLLVFGSEDFAFDSGAVKLLGHLNRALPGWRIRQLIRPEQILEYLGTPFIILDVAAGIDAPLLITDLSRISYRRKISAHDMDLASFLKILRELGQLPHVAIVALPNDRDPNEFKDEIIRMLCNVPLHTGKNREA